MTERLTHLAFVATIAACVVACDDVPSSKPQPKHEVPTGSVVAVHATSPEEAKSLLSFGKTKYTPTGPAVARSAGGDWSAYPKFGDLAPRSGRIDVRQADLDTPWSAIRDHLHRIDFTYDRQQQYWDIEGAFVQPEQDAASFGNPSTPTPVLTQLVRPDSLGIVRFAVDPSVAWKQFLADLPEAARDGVAAWNTDLQQSAGFTFEQVLAALDGHIFVFMYERAPDTADATLWTWIALQATHELTVIGVRDAAMLRKAMHAWTQLSKGKLRVIGPDRWEWREKDEDASWTAHLHEGLLLVSDSPVADAQRERFVGGTGAQLPQRFGERGVPDLFGTQNASGVYIADPVLHQRGLASFTLRSVGSKFWLRLLEHPAAPSEE